MTEPTVTFHRSVSNKVRPVVHPFGLPNIHIQRTEGGYTWYIYRNGKVAAQGDTLTLEEATAFTNRVWEKISQ